MANALPPRLLLALLLLALALAAPHQRGLIFNLVRGTPTPPSLPRPGDAPRAAMGHQGAWGGSVVL